MNLSLDPTAVRRQTRAAATLIECLVYIGVLATLLGVSTSAFYRCYEHMRSLRRNADDITRVLHLGELWRNDVRHAIQPPALDATTQILHIIHKDGVVDYCFAEDQVSRRTTAAAPWSSVLTNLNQSQIRLEQQNGVAAWRWELELKPLRKPARVPPLFTFTAVPESPAAP
ncbi:MAG: hypothetical protein QM813_13635 [Verrucomicrobiota bacterium]